MAKTWLEKYSTNEEVITGSAVAITAFAGGGQSSATALSSKFNSIDTVAADEDSVKLPTTLIGKKIYVFNNASKILSIYPFSGEYINGKLNRQINISPGEVIIFESQVALKWVVSGNSSKGINNLKSISYTIGVAGTAGVDYTFTSVANPNEQSIQLGDAAIIPRDSLITSIIVKCVLGLNGVIAGTADVGISSGSDEYISAANVDDTNEFKATDGSSSYALGIQFSISASSVYFSFTPSANWNTITTGKWKIWISFLDNSMI